MLSNRIAWKFLFLICLLLLIVKEVSWSQTPPRRDTTVVGLIEDSRRQLADLKSNEHGPVRAREVTPAFVSEDGKWSPIKNLNRKTQWAVVYRGRKLAEIVTEPSGANNQLPGPEDVQAILTDPDKVPTIGSPAGTFNGNFETVVRRPLVVTTANSRSYSDPEHWQTSNVDGEIRKKTSRAFLSTFGTVHRCDASGEPSDVRWFLQSSDVLVSAAYESISHSFVIETRLVKRECAFYKQDGHLRSLDESHWFYVSPNGETRHIGDGMHFVDSGDYGGDGKSELVFYLATGPTETIEKEGYILFYDDFRSRAELTWNYAVSQ